MLSLLGFPGTLGFVGKWAILASLVQVRQLPLAVILVVTSLISAGYYLPVIMSAYMREPDSVDSHGQARLPGTAAFTVAIAIAVVLVFGVLPSAALSSAIATAGTMVHAVAAP
jgi:NADH-quinone oxidoreductase subunit N